VKYFGLENILARAAGGDPGQPQIETRHRTGTEGTGRDICRVFVVCIIIIIMVGALTPPTGKGQYFCMILE